MYRIFTATEFMVSSKPKPEPEIEATVNGGSLACAEVPEGGWETCLHIGDKNTQRRVIKTVHELAIEEKDCKASEFVDSWMNSELGFVQPRLLLWKNKQDLALLSEKHELDISGSGISYSKQPH